MYKERKFSQENIIMMSMEEMVPKDHLLRKIDKSRCYSTYKDLILDRRLTLSLSNRIMDLTHEEPYAKQRHSRII